MGDFKFRNVTPGAGDIRLGSSPVAEIFFGTEKVWPYMTKKTITLCGLTWQTLNSSIRVKTGGGTIPIYDNASDLYQARQNQEPAACYFEFDENNSEYGLIYNYYAKDVIVPPSGYRLPTASDFNTLNSLDCIGSSTLNRNRYGANPGSWNMSQLTNTDELGDSGFDAQGYGYGYLVNEQTIFWLHNGIRAGYWVDEAPGASLKAKGFWIKPQGYIGAVSYNNDPDPDEMFFVRFVKDA